MGSAAARSGASRARAAAPTAPRLSGCRKAIAAVLLLLAASAAVAMVLGSMDPWGFQGIFSGGSDLDIYRDGARRALAGLPLYGGPVLYGLLYTYPPFSTLAFIPLGLLPRNDNYIWMAVNIALLAVSIGLCLRILGHRRGLFTAGVSALLAIACTFVEPVRTTLYFGQINIVLMTMVLWDVSCRDRSRLKGIGIGLAAGIKLTPGFFLLYYLARRRWRAAAVGVGTFAATVAVAWALLPAASRTYWTETFFDSNRIADQRNVANQSLRGMIARITDQPEPVWSWLVLSVLLIAACMYVAVELVRYDQKLLAVALVGLTAKTVSPFSWSHHWVWFVPVLVYLVHRALVGRPWWWLAAFGYWAVVGAWVKHWPGSVRSVGLYLFPAPWSASRHFLGNLYPLMYLAILLVLAVYVWRLSRGSAPWPTDRGCSTDRACVHHQDARRRAETNRRSAPVSGSVNATERASSCSGDPNGSPDGSSDDSGPPDAPGTSDSPCAPQTPAVLGSGSDEPPSTPMGPYSGSFTTGAPTDARCTRI